MRKLLAASLLAIAVLITTPALAANAAPRSDPGASALNWAETQAGKPYVWGGTGPYGYDCSGLVYAAFRRVGIDLPRTTYGMLSSAHLQWIPRSEVRRGDLAFYGSGHVEIDTDWPDTTFGAHDFGQPVGWIHFGGFWSPTMYFRVHY